MHASLLQMIDSAWPLTPYPGDQMLSECWCDECEFAVSNLRGKAWCEIAREDFNGENARLQDVAFLYYLPALLRFSLEDPEDIWIASEVMGRFVAIQVTPATSDDKERFERVRNLSVRLTNAQRSALAQYFKNVGDQGWQFPQFTTAAIQCVLDGNVEPVPYGAVMTWARDRERELKQNAR